MARQNIFLGAGMAAILLCLNGCVSNTMHRNYTRPYSGSFFATVVSAPTSYGERLRIYSIDNVPTHPRPGRQPSTVEISPGGRSLEIRARNRGNSGEYVGTISHNFIAGESYSLAFYDDLPAAVRSVLVNQTEKKTVPSDPEFDIRFSDPVIINGITHLTVGSMIEALNVIPETVEDITVWLDLEGNRSRLMNVFMAAIDNEPFAVARRIMNEYEVYVSKAIQSKPNDSRIPESLEGSHYVLRTFDGQDTPIVAKARIVADPPRPPPSNAYTAPALPYNHPLYQPVVIPVRPKVPATGHLK